MKAMEGPYDNDGEREHRAPSRRALLTGLAAGVVAALTLPGRVFGQPSASRAYPAPDAARSHLALGDAAAAVDDIRRARDEWQQAIDIGRLTGSEAAVVAQKRLQMYTLTCVYNYDDKSLAAISRDYEALNGDLINVRVLQRALNALGYYEGQTDGQLTVLTRSAIRKFQRDMAFDETDVLSPREIVYLICNAAETARDESAQTTLGIMYATGIGVRQNIDFALAWMRTASNRFYADATFDLAILYGTGIVLGTIRLCDFPYSYPQADQYLREACEQRHPIAIKLMKLYGKAKSAGERWAMIEQEQLENSAADKTNLYASRLGTVGTKCGSEKRVR
jgi:TPR repeat protein